MADEHPQPPDGAGPPAFEEPHPNGAVHGAPARAAHAPWEFIVLALLVALVGIGIILAWTLVGAHSPERLDPAAASRVAGACDAAQSQLQALPNPYPKLGADRVARLRAENAVLRGMVARFAAVQPARTTPAAALRAWSADWTRMVDARARYADALQQAATTNGKVRFVTPADNGIKPITQPMDDFVRENHPNIDACFTQALQVEQVEGPRVYQKVTS